MIEERLTRDLKQAMLSGNRLAVDTLRTIKSAILYAKVANNTSRDEPMSDNAITVILQKEAKKRQESADLYRQGGRDDRAQSELQEKLIIEAYLPTQLGEQELSALIEKIIVEMGGSENVTIGAAIGRVKESTSGAADGALIAKLVKERLQR
jgi:uncharacterized protein YqeY